MIPTLVVLVLAVACTPDESAPSEQAEESVSQSGDSLQGDDAVASSGAAGAESAEMDLEAALTASDAANPTAWTRHAGITSFVAPNYASSTVEPGDAALEYFDLFSDSYGLSDSRSRLTVTDSWSSASSTVVRLRQTLWGMPLFGGEIAVTVSQEGTVIAVSGVVVPDAEVVEASLDASSALAAALEAKPQSEAAEEEPIAVAVSPMIDGTVGDPVPGWQVTVVTTRDGIPMRELMLVDGRDGSILFEAGIDIDGIAFDIEDAGNAVNDDGDGILDEAKVVLEFSDGEVNEFAGVDERARILATNLETSWEYFLNTHGRDGYDGKGSPCRAYIHVGVDWANATAGSGSCKHRYGDARPYAESLDVVAHEFAHNVTAKTAGLVYQGQSGALNEHYSDFFAAMVDRSDWDLFGIRDLSNPGRDSLGEFLTTEDDKGGVHSNSGIPNRAGFMVANEGSFTHPDSGVEVNGIGREKAEQLWYATLLSLSPRANLGSWACATFGTAKGMEGDLLTTDDVESVYNAMVAVGLIWEYEGKTECEWLTSGRGIGDLTTSDTATTTTIVTTTTTTPESDACDIVGLWRLKDDVFFSEIQRLAGAAASGVVMEHFDGDYWLELREDGTLRDHRDGWGIRIATSDGASVMIIDSELGGTYSTSADTISAVLDAGVADVAMFIEINGQLQALPLGFDAGNSIPVDPVLDGAAAYRCLGDVLWVDTVSEQGSVSVAWDRVG